MTGKLFLALVTLGSWSDAHTTLAQWAAKVTPVVEHVAVAPEAIQQRLHKRARVVLQEMIRQVLAQVQALETVCDDGLFPPFTTVYLAASTGCERPTS